MRGGQPDSATLLDLRAQFIAAIERVPASTLAPRQGRERTPEEGRLLAVVSQAEIQSATLAMEARRPDLALQRSEALRQTAEGDTAILRRADILISGSLRQLGRYDEAIDAMKAMMVRYPPRTPDSTGVEDFVLGLPDAIIDLRRALGDDAGVRREFQAAERYYNGLILAGGLAPGLEAQVRSRLVRTYLEQNNTTAAVAGLDSLETLVIGSPDLRRLIPEVRYTRSKLQSMTGRDPGPSITALERVALDFPNSPVADHALMDAALLKERMNRLPEALDAYRAVITRYPSSLELGATALLRVGIIEERLGRWLDAKATLESVSAKYPRSSAAAQAPITIAEHYARAGDRAGIQGALRRAVEVYTRMIHTDSTAATVVRLRWNKFRALAGLEETDQAFTVIAQMVDRHPGNPLTAQALLEGVRIADRRNLPDVSKGLLARFVQDFPNAPQAAEARQRLRGVSK
jgi:tetratricopeptide (TPR) repeat protein